MEIDITNLVKGNFTYPTRSGNRYELKYRRCDSSTIEVYYEITKGAAIREIHRRFPRYLSVNGRFIWMLGLLRGEGLKSVGPKSSMYRFNVVNNDLAVVKAVIDVLNESKLAEFEKIRAQGGLIRISYGPYCDTAKARRYWAEGLGIEAERVNMASKAEPQKRALYGSCMFTVSDVLLRRVMDLIANRVYTRLFVSEDHRH